MKTLFFLSGALGWALLLPAQSMRYPLSAPGTGLAAYSNAHYDPLAFTANAATLARVKGPGLGFAGERRFMLAQLGSYLAGLELPTRLGNFGVQLQYSGSGGFNEKRVGISCGRFAGKKLDAGIGFQYYSYTIAAVKTASTFTAEAGILVHLTPQVQAGISCYNPVGGKLGKEQGEKLPAVYKFGLGYDVSDRLFTAVEIQKEENKAISVTAGLQYRYAQKMTAELGIVTASSMWFAGAGYKMGKMRLLVSVSYHQQLGITPGMRIFYHFKSDSI